MHSDFDEWIDRNTDRYFGRQARQAETVKILVGLTLALSGTLVATALQVKPPQDWWDGTACIMLAVALLLTILTITTDRQYLPDGDAVLHSIERLGIADEQKRMIYVRMIEEDLLTDNSANIRWMQIGALAQSSACLVSAILSVVSLFR